MITGTKLGKCFSASLNVRACGIGVRLACLLRDLSFGVAAIQKKKTLFAKLIRVCCLATLLPIQHTGTSTPEVFPSWVQRWMSMRGGGG